MEGRNRNVQQLVEQLNTIVPKDKIINDQLENNLSGIFKDSLQFMDTIRDRDVYRNLRQGNKQESSPRQNRTAIANCKDELEGRLDQFCNIEKTSLIVSNAMTNEQQRLFTRRLVQKKKG